MGGSVHRRRGEMPAERGGGGHLHGALISGLPEDQARSATAGRRSDASNPLGQQGARSAQVVPSEGTHLRVMAVTRYWLTGSHVKEPGCHAVRPLNRLAVS